jgi:hypothetical protein
MIRQWRESREVLEDILGHAVDVASVPGGFFSARVAQAAAEGGVRLLFTSEPETRVRRVGGCTVMGRFTVRRGCPADFASTLASLRPGSLRREWLAWNVKKMAKSFLGAAYPWLARLEGSAR